MSKAPRGHQKRDDRCARAYARGGSLPGTKPNPPGSKLERKRRENGGVVEAEQQTKVKKQNRRRTKKKEKRK